MRELPGLGYNGPSRILAGCGLEVGRWWPTGRGVGGQSWPLTHPRVHPDAKRVRREALVACSGLAQVAPAPGARRAPGRSDQVVDHAVTVIRSARLAPNEVGPVGEPVWGAPVAWALLSEEGQSVAESLDQARGWPSGAAST
jgi:hypothetical protein